MPGRKKRKLQTIPIQIGEKHHKSPHFLAIEKNNHGFEITTEPKRNKQRYSSDCARTTQWSFEQQYTKPTKPETNTASSRIRINIPQIDLVGHNHTPLQDDHINIDQHVESAFSRYHHAAKIKKAIINTEKIHPVHLEKTPVHIHHHIIRTTIVFALATLLVTAPLYTARIVAHAQYTKETLTTISKSIASSITFAGSNILEGNIDEAGYTLNGVEVEFAHALHLLESFARDAQLITSTIPPVKKTLSSAQALSEAGLTITQAINEIKTQLANSNTQTNQFDTISKALTNATNYLETARTNINSVQIDVLPAEMRSIFMTLKSEINALLPSLQVATRTTDTLNAVLKQQPRQTLLILFQNNHEIRATGGFWGSFALVTLHNGIIESIDIPKGGTYDIKGQLDRHVRPPTPMQLIATEWQFQDANWFPDFPQSAKQASWFLEHAKYGTPDGVIAITPNILEQILDITGDIELPAFNKTFTKENITHELQMAVELEYDKEENKPKAIIADLTDVLINRIYELNPAKKIALLAAIHDSLTTKDIILYHQNPELEKQLSDAGWAGNINTQWNDDYLMVVNHNIAGQKTDEKIVQDIIKKTHINENGTITSELTIRRTHTGTKGDLFNGVRNVNYMRIMVPEGSELIHAEGFTYPDESLFKVPETFDAHESITAIERTKRIDSNSGTHITLESGKTTFGNWTMTDPGESSVIKITYRLPFVLKHTSTDNTFVSALAQKTSSYTLLAQKQPGADNTTFTHIIEPPNNWDLVESTDIDGDLVESYNLDTDKVSGIVLSQPQP